MPIASIIETLKKGNNLWIIRKGATIISRPNGQVVRLHERQGVYVFKI